MSYRRATLELHSTQKDRIPPDASPTSWNDSLNVFFKDGESRRVCGDKDILADVDITVTARTMAYTEAEGTPFLVIAGEDGIEATDGVNAYDITPDYWFPDSFGFWTSCVINGFVVINCSTDEPVYWDGDTANICEPLPDWPTGRFCNAMRQHKGFLFALGMTDTGGSEVLWSDSAEAGTFPQHWTAGASNDAGSTNLAPYFTRVLDGATMGDEFILYKEKSIWAAQFVGGQYIFSFREVSNALGLAWPNALCHGPNGEHLFVTNAGDIMVSSGGRIASVLEGRGIRDFQEAYQENRGTPMCCATYPEEQIAYVVYAPSGSSLATRALLFDWTSGDIGYREMPNTYCLLFSGASSVDPTGRWNDASSITEAWSAGTEQWNTTLDFRSSFDLLSGGESGVISHTSMDADDFLSGEVTATLTKKGIALSDDGRRGLIRRIWPKVTGTDGDALSFTLLSQETADGPVVRSATQTYYIGQNRHIDVMLAGRFLGIEVKSVGGSPWRMGTVDIEYRPIGRF